MGRGIKTGTVPRGVQRRVTHCRSTALPLGASYVDRSSLAVGITQAFQQGFDALQTEYLLLPGALLAGSLGHGRLMVDQGEQPVD